MPTEESASTVSLEKINNISDICSITQEQIDTELKNIYQNKESVLNSRPLKLMSFDTQLKFTTKDGTELGLPVTYKYKEGVARIFINGHMVYDKKTFANMERDDIGLDYPKGMAVYKIYSDDPIPVTITNKTLSAKINSYEKPIQFLGGLSVGAVVVLSSAAILFGGNILLPPLALVTMFVVGATAMRYPQAFTNVVKIPAQGLGMKPDEYPSEKNKSSDGNDIKDDCVKSQSLQTGQEHNNRITSSQGDALQKNHTQDGRPSDLGHTETDIERRSDCSKK